MPEYLSQLLADAATALVRESFTGVGAEWWWERRLGGGIVVCQELARGHDPEFVEWRWEPMRNLPDLVIPFKREVY